MDTLRSMRVFLAVVRRQGFASAAQELGMSTSAASRWVLQLEDWLGVQLLRRTTRQLSLTQEGHYYLERIEALVAGVDELKDIAERRWGEPQGVLRVTAPPFVCRAWLQDILPEFLASYPGLVIDLTAVDRVVDLVSEGYDLAIRIGVLADSTLIARRLADMTLALVASPAYLAQHGRPGHWTELKHHNCLVDTVAGYGHRWPFREGGKARTLVVNGNLQVNSGVFCRELAIAGVGITLLPRFMVAEALATGELECLFADAVDFEAGVYVVYPQRRHGAPALRCFVDYLATRIDRFQT
ncbi:LysR family transcriptional regulator [Halomonas sp. BC04]|uniref:LysR family transcriptional regulator n=1 Tax=Halomonas sp. BC04 TaxID=1403540 RepID=UPI0003ED5FFF|nr:LysR family transcriptional regulator [Halomonas sp. BC04]EWG98760.1 LysR family transcriptional regulator [Halomonas sp. BC04]